MNNQRNRRRFSGLVEEKFNHNVSVIENQSELSKYVCVCFIKPDLEFVEVNMLIKFILSLGQLIHHSRISP